VAAVSRWRLWGPVVAWMALLFLVSSRPVPDAVAHVPDWLSHGAAYAVLGVLACRAFAGGLRDPAPRRAALAAVVVSTLYGVTDEAHQSFVPGRLADPWDVVKDLVGASVGAAACAAPRSSAGASRRKAA
jgi:VanZ family protein